MTHHANHVLLIGQVIQTWTYSNDRMCRVQMTRAAFQPLVDGSARDLVNVVLPEAVTRGVIVKKGDELHITGFIRNEDREVSLASIAGNIELPEQLKDLKVRQIVTQVYATSWQIV